MILKKNKLNCLITLVIALSFIPQVKAVTLPKSDTCYYFNRTTGSYSSSKLTDNYAKDCVKTLSGEHAYCIEWQKAITSSSYKINSNWKETSKNSIIAGMIIEKVYKEYSGTKAYAMTSAVLNTFASKDLSYAKSRNFYNSTNKEIKKFYDEAHEQYTQIYKSSSLPMGDITKEIEDKSSVMNYNAKGEYYISNKITLKNLKETYGRTTDKVTYVITANKNAQICTSASGSSTYCKSSVSISGKTSYSFWVKVAKSNVTSKDTISVKIAGSNSSKYPTTKQYISTNDSSTSQKLLVKTQLTIDRSNSTSLSLSVPNLEKHTIKAIKVDELGHELEGATLAIYQDNPTTGKKLIEGTGTSISYTSELEAANDVDFFNHDYYLVEKSSPNGYVLFEPILIYEKGTSTTKKTVCYHNVNEESKVADSAERCNFENYDYMCKNDTTGEIVGLNSQGECGELMLDENNKPINETGEGGETGGDQNTESGNEGENPPVEPPAPTFTKICTKLDTKTQVTDETYCTKKSEYTKIESSNQGNITITQPNKRNELSISKKDITGDKEVPGATLKICTKETYEINHLDCEAAKTIKDAEGNQITMKWVSTKEEKVFHGIPTGEYYIIEVLPPNGYIKETTVKQFQVDKNGKILSNGKELTDSIVINNKINSLSISKQDIATSKELPGATLSICLTYLDENNKIQLETNQYTGDCIPAILSDGTKATWKSTKEPHKVTGLASGTYYLVENIAPTNYSTAESILFTIKDDGKIYDSNNKLISNNKIVMKDKKIKEVKTGDLHIMSIFIICITCLATGAICYHYSNKKYGLM